MCRLRDMGPCRLAMEAVPTPSRASPLPQGPVRRSGSIASACAVNACTTRVGLRVWERACPRWRSCRQPCGDRPPLSLKADTLTAAGPVLRQVRLPMRCDGPYHSSGATGVGLARDGDRADNRAVAVRRVPLKADAPKQVTVVPSHRPPLPTRPQWTAPMRGPVRLCAVADVPPRHPQHLSPMKGGASTTAA